MPRFDPQLVSAVVPAYNAAVTISATLNSVRAQTYNNLEIIVVDDGSSDATAEIVQNAALEDQRVILISQPNGGVARARNAGIAASRGAYLAFIDADDLWHPRKIELQLRAMRAVSPEHGFVYAWSRRIDENDHVLSDQGKPTYEGRVFTHLIQSNFTNNASVVLIRRESLLAAGGFDPGLQDAGLHGAEDLKLYLAIAERETVGFAPYFLIGYRNVANSMSSASDRMRRSVEMVLADVEARRPELRASVLQSARMNYDLYAASLAFAARRFGQSARYLISAIRREPATAFALLGCEAAWRLQRFLSRSMRKKPFHSLSPDEDAIRLVFSEFVDGLKTRRAYPVNPAPARQAAREPVDA